MCKTFNVLLHWQFFSMAVTQSRMFSKQSFPPHSSAISLQAETGAEQNRDFSLFSSTSKLTTSIFRQILMLFGTCQYKEGLLSFLEHQCARQTFYIILVRNHNQTFCKKVILPSNNSSKSSTKNSRNGGRLGRFSVLTSCWIFADTLLLTGTPAGQGSIKTSVDHNVWWRSA